MAAFKFNESIRPVVRQLTESLARCNELGNRHASQRETYGHICNAVEAIIRIECGEAVLNEINHSRYGYNWGGNATRLDDVEAAVQDALEELSRTCVV